MTPRAERISLGVVISAVALVIAGAAYVDAAGNGAGRPEYDGRLRDYDAWQEAHPYASPTYYPGPGWR